MLNGANNLKCKWNLRDNNTSRCFVLLQARWWVLELQWFQCVCVSDTVCKEFPSVQNQPKSQWIASQPLWLKKKILFFLFHLFRFSQKALLRSWRSPRLVWLVWDPRVDAENVGDIIYFIWPNNALRMSCKVLQDVWSASLYKSPQPDYCQAAVNGYICACLDFGPHSTVTTARISLLSCLCVKTEGNVARDLRMPSCFNLYPPHFPQALCPPCVSSKRRAYNLIPSQLMLKWRIHNLSFPLMRLLALLKKSSESAIKISCN